MGSTKFLQIIFNTNLRPEWMFIYKIHTALILTQLKLTKEKKKNSIED